MILDICHWLHNMKELLGNDPWVEKIQIPVVHDNSIKCSQAFVREAYDWFTNELNPLLKQYTELVNSVSQTFWVSAKALGFDCREVQMRQHMIKCIKTLLVKRRPAFFIRDQVRKEIHRIADTQKGKIDA